jgi:hypothetical protein
MRIKTSITCLAAGLLTFGQPAWAAGNSANTQSHSASLEPRYPGRQTHRPAPLSRQAVFGVIPRAIRGGQPVQMLNPIAPAKYGTAEENVSFDPEVPGKGNGINFFSISF